MSRAQNNPQRRGKQSLADGSSALGVRERLLAAGVEIVSEVGLDTGLGRLNFEEAIKRAHVARATAIANGRPRRLSGMPFSWS